MGIVLHVSAYIKQVFVKGLTPKTVLIKLICIFSITLPILLPHISQAYNNIGLIRVSDNSNTMFTGMCLCFLKYVSSIALASVACCTNVLCEYFRFP